MCGFSVIFIVKRKNETESKMENPTHYFQETNLVRALSHVKVTYLK